MSQQIVPGPNSSDNNIISDKELAVLCCLSERQVVSKERVTTDLSEISFTTGIRDNDEVLRALYTLEGKSLVAPEPKGDFTSANWQITANGLKAVEIVSGV